MRVVVDSVVVVVVDRVLVGWNGLPRDNVGLIVVRGAEDDAVISSAGKSFRKQK